jgi:VanZ family protein
MAYYGDDPVTDKVHQKKTDTWRGRILRYAPLILWIVVIFLLSSGSGSTAATSRIIRPLLEFLFPTASEESLQLMHFYIRKTAHFTEYAVLGYWALRAFTRTAAEWLRNHPYISAFVIVITVASLDEFNQRFISSRTGSVWDVLLDISGGIFAIAAWYFVSRLKR